MRQRASVPGSSDTAGRVDRAMLRALAAQLLDEELADMVADALYNDEALEPNGDWRGAYDAIWRAPHLQRL